MKIAITGGSGFIGSKLAKALAGDGHTILILDRVAPREASAGVSFIKTNLVSDLPLTEYLSCDAVIHLAGVNIFGRWTEEYKKLILSSRVDTARALILAVKDAGYGPRVFVSASAIGFYGDGGEQILDESTPNGTDFLARVCGEWERVAMLAQELGMRVVSIRTGIVLGPGGGMLAKLLPIFRLGLGGRMGSGKQWFSWISLADIIAVYQRVVTDGTIAGPVNAVSPQPIRNRDLAKALGRTLHRPAFLAVPGVVLRLVLGELAGAVLMSQRVVPQKLLHAGFTFTAGTIDEALKESVR